MDAFVVKSPITDGEFSLVLIEYGPGTSCLATSRKETEGKTERDGGTERERDKEEKEGQREKEKDMEREKKRENRKKRCVR